MKGFLIIILSFSFASLWSQSLKTNFKKYPKEVQKIILTESGIFRGSVFGEAKSVIKARETVKLQAESDSVLTYSMNIDADDSADILYYFDTTGNAKSFAVVFILQDANEELNLKSNLIKYFNERYGAFAVVNQEDELWNSNAGYVVEMKDTSDEAGMEIEIVYYKP